jgi:Domain of unknown function (DUF4150)
MYPRSTKQGGIAIAFPDVCMTPPPPSYSPFVPIPYPNVGAAIASVSKVPGGSSPTSLKTSGGYSVSSGDAAGTLKGVSLANASYVGAPMMAAGYTPAFVLGSGGGLTPERQAAATQLRAILANVHSQLLAMPGSNPNKWHDLLDTYIVATADLYKVLAWR